METVNADITVLVKEVRKMRKELAELRLVLVPEEEISEAERTEIRTTFAKMAKGERTNWRDTCRQ